MSGWFIIREHRKLKLNIMKNKLLLCAATAVILALTGCESEHHHCCCHRDQCEHREKKESQADLLAQAKVTKDDAAKTALAQVPNGSIQEAELEKEHGKLIWSFDLTTPDSKDITEVNICALSGKVVNIEKESPQDQAKEKDEDAKESKHDKDDDGDKDHDHHEDKE
jgi:uncharacterized membrane protein YkoI